VTAAVYRYNSAIIAQAFASLDVHYSGKIGLGVGTGEAMNEVPVGFDWPSADVRLARNTEAIQIIRKLWEGSKKEKDNKISGKNSGFIEFNGQYLKSRMQHSARLPLRRKYHYIHGSKWRRSDPTAAKYTDGF